jgi:hypothetical protein
MFRQLSTKSFTRPETEFAPGPAPQLQWLETEKLLVDPTYQRDIGKRGSQNIRQIAENFDWSKFAPVIVAPVEGGLFAIVDGQHRTTAAMLRDILSVPCQVVQADRAKQAEAYAAVNGNVTKTTPQQLFHARLAAQDPKALEIAEICAAGFVEIVRRNVPLSDMKRGHTQAIGAITRCLDFYGRETLITALQCITQTSDGNPGFVRPTIIEALCEVLKSNPQWRDAGEKLLRTMDNFDFADAWEEVMAGRNFILSPAVKSALVERIRAFLAKRLRLKNAA